jgi:hypothetical protein
MGGTAAAGLPEPVICFDQASTARETKAKSDTGEPVWPRFAFFSQYVMPSSPYITVSGGQAILGLLRLAESPVQPAEAEVACATSWRISSSQARIRAAA